MYMSRVRLDLSRRETMQALAFPQRIHGALEAAYTGERCRNLWRLDWHGGACDLLVVSKSRLDLHHLSSQFGYGAGNWECKDYDTLLKRIAPGTVWQFRLCANPVISLPADGSRGRVHAHLTPKHQCAWLLARAEKHGFSLKENEFGVIGDRWLIFRKGGQGEALRIRQVTFSGMLTVTDATAFQTMLTQGLGKGKAYGCGMMTIVAPQHDEEGRNR